MVGYQDKYHTTLSNPQYRKNKPLFLFCPLFFHSQLPTSKHLNQSIHQSKMGLFSSSRSSRGSRGPDPFNYPAYHHNQRVDNFIPGHGGFLPDRMLHDPQYQDPQTRHIRRVQGLPADGRPRAPPPGPRQGQQPTAEDVDPHYDDGSEEEGAPQHALRSRHGASSHGTRSHASHASRVPPAASRTRHSQHQGQLPGWIDPVNGHAGLPSTGLYPAAHRGPPSHGAQARGPGVAAAHVPQRGIPAHVCPQERPVYGEPSPGFVSGSRSRKGRKGKVGGTLPWPF